MGTTRQATFLEPANRRLYAAFFLPESPVANPLACVLCHPFFEEKKAAHRILAQLALSLAEAGHAALLLDLSGCGDSSGNLADFSPDIWQDDIRQGLAGLQQRVPNTQPAFVGVRLGATLALQTAIARETGTQLVLVDPVLNGSTCLRDMLRQKQIREMMTFRRARASLKTEVTNLQERGYIDADGIRISSELYDALGRLTIEQITPPQNTRTLVIQQASRDTLMPELDNTLASWEKCGMIVEHACIKAVPFWKTTDLADPTPVLNTIREWLT